MLSTDAVVYAQTLKSHYDEHGRGKRNNARSKLYISYDYRHCNKSKTNHKRLYDYYYNNNTNFISSGKPIRKTDENINCATQY